jgi:hypothetical protein
LNGPQERLDNLAKKLSAQTDIIDDVDSWTGHFVDYVIASSPPGTFDGFPKMNASRFHSKLTQFLFSPKGGKYRSQFKFADPPTCGKESSRDRFYKKLIFGPKTVWRNFDR